MVLEKSRAKAHVSSRWCKDTVVLVVALLVVSVLSWMYTRTVTGNMDVMMSMGMFMPGMDRPVLPVMATLFLTTWLVMMLAMMLPSATPMILLYDRYITRQSAGKLARVATGIFVSGYFIVWLCFGSAAFIATLAQLALIGSYPDIVDYGHYAGGAVLLAAGIYQLTPLKNVCLRHCRTPLSFMMQHWHYGKLGALRMGLHHGAYCVGCCWGLMLVLFVVGLMNLTWMALLALAIFLEKLIPQGILVSRLTGIALMGLGLLMALRPSIASQFIPG